MARPVDSLTLAFSAAHAALRTGTGVRALLGGINHNGVGELRHANDQRNVEQRLLLIKREAVSEAAMFVDLRSMLGGGDKK